MAFSHQLSSEKVSSLNQWLAAAGQTGTAFDSLVRGHARKARFAGAAQ